MIKFEIEDTKNSVETIEVPEEISLNLMEVLKASNYPVLATCGGMALCATCHVEVQQGVEDLMAHTDAELDMLDTLPDATGNSRLACQIEVGKHLNGARFKLKPFED